MLSVPCTGGRRGSFWPGARLGGSRCGRSRCSTAPPTSGRTRGSVPNRQAAPRRHPGALRLARRPSGAARESGRVRARPEARRDQGRDAGPDAGGDARDRALLSVMVFSFARVSAAVGMRRQDYFRQGVRGWLRLHEKGGKRHDVPAHHRAEEAVEEYVAAAGLEGARAPLFQSLDRTGRLSGRPLGRRAVLAMIKRRAVAAGLPATTCCHTFRATGITAYLVERGKARARPADRGGTRRRRRRSCTTGRRTRSRSTRSSAS